MHPLFDLHWSFYLRRLRLLAIAAVALPVFSAVAQQMPAGHDMNDMRPITPPEQLPVPVHMSAIGNAHIAITATPEAQVWFDQGLNLLHDFWEYESRKAFEQGVRVDPKCAMCYWGLAKAEEFRGKDLKSFAKQDLEKAAELENNVSEPERLYIEAARAEFASEGKRGNNKQEIALLRELASKLPNDTHAFHSRWH
jgi:hypothetical protein